MRGRLPAGRSEDRVVGMRGLVGGDLIDRRVGLRGGIDPQAPIRDRRVGFLGVAQRLFDDVAEGRLTRGHDAVCRAAAHRRVIGRQERRGDQPANEQPGRQDHHRRRAHDRLLVMDSR